MVKLCEERLILILMILMATHLSSFFSTTSRSSPVACFVMRSISAMHCNVSEIYHNGFLNHYRVYDLKSFLFQPVKEFKAVYYNLPFPSSSGFRVAARSV